MLAEYRRDRINDDQEREAKAKTKTMQKHSTIEITWLLIHLKRDKAGCREVVSANQRKTEA